MVKSIYRDIREFEVDIQNDGSHSNEELLRCGLNELTKCNVFHMNITKKQCGNLTLIVHVYGV